MWLSQVAEHAYRDKTSCYAWAVTRQGYLRYYNLTARKRKRAAWIFTDNPLGNLDAASNIITVSRAIQKSNTGLLNKYRGYGVYAGDWL